MASLSFISRSRISSISFLMVVGVMPCLSFHSIWTFLLCSVSSMASFMAGLILSAYIMTLPSAFLAARPMVWISDVAERRKPILSASRMATRETSGRSRPSLRRLMPTSTSYFPFLKSLSISTLSMVSTSLWRYCTLRPRPRR